MGKEYFESLERLAMPDELHIKECKKLGIGLTEDYDVVEQALLRLEAIDNANPSGALKSFETLEIHNKYDNCWQIFSTDIKQALLKAEQDKKKATCWDIVVKKNVDMLLIKKYDNVSDYNSAVWLSGREKLTEEEFNTLKKEIKNDINM